MTEMAVSQGQGFFSHTNVYAGSKPLATYCVTGQSCNGAPTTFALADWLGTKRVQATSSGAIDGNGQDTYASLPYGDQQFAPPGAAEIFFTGKERDAESGNDYFGARYYASSMGRFMSPDWSAKEDPIPYAQLGDPQSLNLYSYVQNNPLVRVDADGHCFEDACVLEGTAVVGGGSALLMYGGAALAGAVGLTGLAQTLHNNGDSIMSGVESIGIKIGSIFSKKDAPAPAASDGKTNTGPKAATAAGVTAGGQATDEHGNKLGPSRKPQVNKTKSNTRKGAQEKALSEGSGTVEHSNPTVGKPHFHPTGADGDKKPSSTHHEYPN